jgi:hypothetical protein
MIGYTDAFGGSSCQGRSCEKATIAKANSFQPALVNGATVVVVASRALTMAESASGLTLAAVLVATSGLFCLATLFFGTKGGFYDSKAYEGNGTAH